MAACCRTPLRISTAGVPQVSSRKRRLYRDIWLNSIDRASSIVSTDPRLRQVVTDAVRRIAGQMDIVTEGRDTTTVIFPDAACKFYFDATPEVRAQRRIAQQGEGQSYEEVLRLIMERDERDRNKEVGSLKVAPDAVIIDTSHLTIAQVCEKVVSVVRSRSGMGVDK